MARRSKKEPPFNDDEECLLLHVREIARAASASRTASAKERLENVRPALRARLADELRLAAATAILLLEAAEAWQRYQEQGSPPPPRRCPHLSVVRGPDDAA